MCVTGYLTWWWWHPKSLSLLLVHQCQRIWVNADVSRKQRAKTINSGKKKVLNANLVAWIGSPPYPVLRSVMRRQFVESSPTRPFQTTLHSSGRSWGEMRCSATSGDMLFILNQFGICSDTFTTQYTALMTGSVCYSRNYFYLCHKIILINKICTKTGRFCQSNQGVTRFRQNTTVADYYGNYTTVRLGSSILACHCNHHKTRNTARIIHAVGCVDC